jgi:hypothetical protein
MNEARQHFSMRQTRQVRARLAQPQTAKADGANLKFTIDQIVQSHALREKVSP